MARFIGWHLTRTGILFVIGIIVLGGLVTGGVFLIKNHGEMVRRDQAAKIAEQNLEDQSKTTTQPADTGTSQTNTSTGTHVDNGATTTTSTNSTNANTSQLPVTGIDPLTTLETAGILAILAFSVTSFITSRRAASRV